MSTRDSIADALSTVTGVHGYAVPPTTLLPGISWPIWQGAAPDSYGGLRSTWHVLVTLPNPDLATTIDAADPLVDTVWAALLDVGEVSAIDVAQVQVADPAGAAQPLPALRFTLLTSGDRS